MAMTRTETKARAGLDAETLRLMYRHMLRSRLLDERLWVLNRQGRAPFWISAEGPRSGSGRLWHEPEAHI